MVKQFLLSSAALAVVACTVTAQPVPAAITAPPSEDAAVPVTDAGPESDAGMSACMLGTASSYDGAAFETNAKDELALRPLFTAFSQLMKDAEAGTKAPTASEVRALFDAGSPSLRSLTAPGFAAEVDTLIDAFGASVGQTYVPSATLPATGGKYGAYIFGTNGIDLRQAIEKGLFGALFYRRAAEIMAGEVKPADIDRLVALFGAHPRFPGDDKDATNPDVLSATYSERRDKKDASNPGPYLKFKAAAIKAQLASRQGAVCKPELAEALTELKKSWERSLAGTLVYYLNDAGPKLDAADTAVWPAALHSYGEVIAFIDGFRFTPAADRIVQDAQIAEMLTLLKAPTKATAQCYAFATGQGIASTEFTKVLSKLVTTYGFSANEVETFKTNY